MLPSHSHTAPCAAACPPGPVRQQAWHPRAAKRQRVEPCRVTNEESAFGEPTLPPGKMRVGPRYQVPEPEKGGTLGQRVAIGWLDAYYRGEPSQADTDYWFTEPAGGWNQETRVINAAEETPYAYATGRNPEFYNREAVPLEWDVGTVVTGKVSKMMLYHGFQVDLGFALDGLIAMLPHEAAWAAVPHDMDLGTEVKAKICRMDPAPRARFPIQLELLEPAHAVPAMLAPHLHHPSYDLTDLHSFEALQWGTGMEWRATDEREPVELSQEDIDATMGEMAETGMKGPRRRTEWDTLNIPVPEFPADALE